MLIRRKYFIIFFVVVFLVLILMLVDLERQQNLAEQFAKRHLEQIITKESSLTELGLPTSLKASIFDRVDTNYTFTQWEVVFAFESVVFSFQAFINSR